MELANKLCYDGALVCGSKEVADCFLPELTPKTQVDGSLWKLLLQPRPAVVFYDTSKMATLEEQIDSSVRNSTEADLVHRMVDLYLECGVRGSSIGVISPYRGQKQELQQRLAASTVEVNTIDQFQGRDKEIVLISLVKTNPSSEEHHILHDWRRINVALTRAKKKLVLVGHATNLRTYPPIAKVLSILPTESVLQVDASALTA